MSNITPQDLTRREVHYCVSALVHTLAQTSLPRSAGDITELCEQAQELAYPIEDFLETLIDEGCQVRHDALGYYVLTDDEAAHEDAGNPSVGFDGRDHFENATDAAREWLSDADIEPLEREIYEHWIVSDWFADKLAEKGEKVDKDFAGMTVWGRTTTGQAIYMDSVVQKIHAELITRSAL